MVKLKKTIVATIDTLICSVFKTQRVLIRLHLSRHLQFKLSFLLIVQPVPSRRRLVLKRALHFYAELRSRDSIKKL